MSKKSIIFTKGRFFTNVKSFVKKKIGGPNIRLIRMLMGHHFEKGDSLTQILISLLGCVKMP